MITQTERHESDLGSPVLRGLLSQKAVAEALGELAKPSETISIPPARCAGCNNLLPEQMIRGKAQRLKPWLISVQAQGFCPKCQHTTPVQMLIHGNGNVDMLVKGQWVTRRPSRMPEIREELQRRYENYRELAGAMWDKFRTAAMYLYENRNEPLSSVFARPALAELLGKRS